MKLAINARLGPDAVKYVNSSMLSEYFLGDSIYANIIILGASYQAGLVPLSAQALKQAIRLNGANIEENLKAFEIGRLWIEDHDKVLQEIPSGKNNQNKKLESFNDIIKDRYQRLVDYQNKNLANKYRDKCFEIKEIDRSLAISVARAYF